MSKTMTAKNKSDRQGLKEQIASTCSWWKTEYADEVKGFTPSLKAYEKGVKLAAKLAVDILMVNAGIGEEIGDHAVSVEGTTLTGYLPTNPARLLDVQAGAPDNPTVDELVQLGLFGCIVFG